MAKRWTKQENTILLNLIKKGKFPKATKEVSVSLGRTEAAVYARYCSLKKNLKPKNISRFYTKEEEKIILEYVTNPENANLQGLQKQLGRSEKSIYIKLHHLRKKYPEIRKFTRAKVRMESLKQIMEEKITKNKHNLRQAFREVSEETGLSPRTIQAYWYGGDTYGKQLSRKNMPALFYTSDSKGLSKNEKNTNVLQEHKGKYIFSMITSWLNRRFKVKSRIKKNSK